jgi:HK97 family phage prohead protease
MSTTPTISAPTIERRYTAGAVELRMDGDGAEAKRKVRGYAAVFGAESENLGGESYRMFEKIERGAFDAVLKDDVRALFNHDANLILARSKGGAGTLALGVDERGLWYEFEAPDTQAGRDLLVSLQRGDVDQSSFAFTVSREGQKWEEETRDGVTTARRTITKVSRLYDVSPVTYPAYPDASAALRSLTEHRAAATPPAPAANHSPITGAQAARLGLTLT